MRIQKVILFVISLFFGFSSCLLDETDSPEEQKKRTVLVYIGRDNNLNTLDEDKRASIIDGWNGKGGSLVIYQDLPEGAILEEIKKENQRVTSRIIYEREEENSADPEIWARVIRETIVACPADSYGLILFSHATGWLPDNSFDSPRSSLKSIVRDNDDRMNLADFAKAIPDKMFDFIVFEACLMGGVEVVYELRNKAEYILTSSAEILSPGFRNVYKTSVSMLFLPEPDLVMFTTDVFFTLEAATFNSATISLTRTAHLEELAAWIRVNCKEAPYPETNSIQVFDRRSPHLFYDFEHHFSRLINEESKRSELTALLDKCVLRKYATPSFLISYGGFNIERHSGLTTYIEQESFPYLNEVYKETAWAKAIAR